MGVGQVHSSEFSATPLIPGPLTNVMEEPAVELSLLDGPGIRTSLGRLDFPGYILGRDNVRCGPVGMHTERPAY